MTENDNNVTVLKPAAKPRPKKGRGGTHNFPNARQQPETPEEKAACSKLLKQILEDYHQPKVKNDDELIEAFDAYFVRCVERNSIPTVEGLYMSTGYTIEHMREICNGRRGGFSTETASIIKKAKNIIQQYDAQSAIEGKVNPIVYFFRAKNYYGMVDKQEYVVTPNTRSDSDYNAEDIAKRYLIDGSEAKVDTTFSGGS